MRTERRCGVLTVVARSRRGRPSILDFAPAGAYPRTPLNRPTTVKIRVPPPLRDHCAGASEIELSALTVRAVLAELERGYPSLHRSICDETGAVRRHVNLFVNTSHIRDRDGLDTALVPGDEVTILPAVSGGSTCRSE